MARWKDANWNCGNGDMIQSVEHAQLAVLMDIRDELKKLNALFHCSNFTRIPQRLDAIHRKMPANRAPAKGVKS